jgi:hypothetical protein
MKRRQKMSAYSDWRCGALTDEKYKQLSRWDGTCDMDIDEDYYWYVDTDDEENEEDDEDDR